MKTRILITLFCTGAVFFAGCAKHGALGLAGKGTPCRVEIIFSQSTTSYQEGAIPEDPFWVGVEAAVSDSTFDFGYLNDLGNFIHVFSGKEGSFEAGGGQKLYFALRESGGKRTVYGMKEYGVCRFGGTQLKANKAVLPARKQDYYGSVELAFDVPGRGAVIVILTSYEPNGFAPSED